MRMPCIAAAIGLTLAIACAPASPQAKPGKPPHQATSTVPASLGERLLKAAQRKDLGAVRMLLDAGADVNARETSGQYRTVVEIAAEHGDFQIVRLLLDRGAKVNWKGPIPAAPLMGALAAIERGKTPEALEMVRLLLDRGADPNATGVEQSAGEWALTLGLDVLTLLLHHGLNVNAVSINGQTLIEAAVHWGKLDAVKALLDAGADPNVLDRDGSSLCATVASEEARKILRAAGGKEILLELPKDVDLSSPQNTLESFAKAITRGDVRGMALCVSYARPHQPLTRLDWLAKGLAHDGLQVRFALSDLKEEKRGEEVVATATLETHATARDGSEAQPRIHLVETMELLRESGRWRIIPYGTHADGGSVSVTFANDLARCTVEDYDPAKSARFYPPFRRLSPSQLLDAIECRIRMAVLTLQVLRFAQAHGGVLAIDNKTMLDKVCGKYDPEFIGRCAARDQSPMAFRFNEKLANVKLSDIKNPDSTILLYEGSAGKPAFRHGGDAMVAFVSGVCWLVDRQLLGYERWTPK